MKNCHVGPITDTFDPSTPVAVWVPRWRRSPLQLQCWDVSAATEVHERRRGRGRSRAGTPIPTASSDCLSWTQMLTRAASLFISLVATVVLVACGGGDGDGAGSAETGAASGTLTLQQRQAVLSAVADRATQIAGQGGDFASGVAAYLQSRPELTSVALTPDGGVTAQFADGELVFVANNRQLIKAAASGQRVARARALSAAITLPGSTKKAVITEGFGGGCDSDTEKLTIDLDNWLSDAGYSVAAAGSVNADFMRTNIKQVDVFVHTGHGEINDAGLVSLTLAFPPPAARSATDDADFGAQRLVDVIGATCLNDDGTPLTGQNTRYGAYWGMTPAFVSKYMTFNPGSLVVINTCIGAHPLAVVQGFPAAFANAASYLAWTGNTDDSGNNQIRYAIDRMLGEVPGGGGRSVTQESPPQRAFDVNAVLQDMTTQGLIPLASSGRMTNLVNLGPGNSILAPSIRHVQVDELNGLLDVDGLLDPNQPGTVSVGGQDCPIVAWASNHATCTLLKTGAGSEGDVVVTVHGIKSNAVALSSWTGAFTYSVVGEQSITATATMNVHWRSDLHKWRNAPHTDPVRYAFPTGAAGDSNASVTASGSATEPNPNGPSSTLHVSAGLTVPLLTLSNAASPPYFTAGALLDPDALTASLLFSIVTPSDSPIATTGNVCDGGYPLPLQFLQMVKQTTWQQIGPDGTPIGSQPYVGLPTTLDASYAIAAGRLTGTDSSCPFAISPDYSWAFSWPKIAVSSPPDPTSAQ